MLDALQSPIVLAVIVVVLLILIAIPVLVRRRRAGREDLLPPPELGQAVDYTSLPYEEPTSLGDRLREAPIGVKLLLALVPIAVIVAAVVLWLTFFNNPGPTTAVVPTPAPPAAITNIKAILIGASRIAVDAETTLPDNTIVTAVMKDGDQDFAWFSKDRATAKTSGGRITVVLEKARGAPQPTSDREQFVTLIATVGDQVISSEPAKITVPALYKGDFYGLPAAAQPTVAPTVAATVAPTNAPAAPTALVEPTATAAPTSTLTATVFNGGNIRKEPQVGDNILGQLHAGEVVRLLERSSDSTWYRVAAPEAEGWVSATLLTIDAEVAKQVPAPAPPETGLSALVFNGGNVRERPVTGKPLDQINAGETVKLLAKTSDGGWYQISYTRDGKLITGWVSVTLLKIDSATAKQVPVAK
ncbi:MAG: SH3 domain-containing protein [Roseiflexaceae bacterium]